MGADQRHRSGGQQREQQGEGRRTLVDQLRARRPRTGSAGPLLTAPLVTWIRASSASTTAPVTGSSEAPVSRRPSASARLRRDVAWLTSAIVPDRPTRGVTPGPWCRLPREGDAGVTQASERLSGVTTPSRRVPSVSVMDPTIEVAGLRKRYGATVAVDDLTFTVRPGQVTGFVGPNGAGKSTTMRIVLGLDAAGRGNGAASAAGRTGR